MLSASDTGFNSRLSLKPLADVLRGMIREKKPGAATLYAPLLERFDAVPELLESHADLAPLEAQRELVDTLLSTIFPPGTSASEEMYAVAVPFTHETIYASAPFRERFLSKGDNCIEAPDYRTYHGISSALQKLAFNLILRRFYKWDLPAVATSVHPFTDRDTELTHFLELRLDASFVDVRLESESFQLPADYSVQRSLDLEDLCQTFPLEHFCFEGLIVINVIDVTAGQAINEIKNTLLNLRSFSELSLFDDLQRHIQAYLGLSHVQVGITPFFQINGLYHFSELHCRKSLLFSNEKVRVDKSAIAARCQTLFADSDHSWLFSALTPQSGIRNEFLPYYYELGIRSLILCPLKSEDGKLIGLLEIASEEPGYLRYQQLSRIQGAVSLFTLALEKSLDALTQEIDRTIKEHFTAVQPAVEWKFTEAAFEYLQQRHDDEAASLPPISFADVYPLYAQIDVRNSSQERNTAIRRDLEEQLELAQRVLKKAGKSEFPLLKAVRFRIGEYREALAGNLLSDDEGLLYEFLRGDLQDLMQHLLSARPELHDTVTEYLQAIDPEKKVLYRHRRAYEESITRINEALDRFIDREQAQMQKIFPHYFERYVTDGIEFNMYVGQSLAPAQPFREIYVSNLKLWQLTLLAKAALLTQVLESRLPLRLQTTQLILAQSTPISISFRRKERKFDVDGAYNIRYEIVKKRIDKVHTRAGERLTQPGTVAIVYSQQKELNEYLGYVAYLKSEGLIEGEPEFLELEDLQGVNGLKAIRLKVHLHEERTLPIQKPKENLVEAK